MGTFQLQGRLGLFRLFNSSPRHVSKNKSSLVLGIIIFVHAMIVFLVLNEKIKQREFAPEEILRMVNVLPENEKLVLEPEKPEVIVNQRPLQFNIPQIQLPELVPLPSEIPLNTLPSENSGQYGNVFDPKLRQKLLDAKRFNMPRAAEKSNTWTTQDGRTFVEVGDGVCMVSMRQVDSRDRATNWGFTTCGKTNSEKAMDRVNADFESRRVINKPKAN